MFNYICWGATALSEALITPFSPTHSVCYNRTRVLDRWKSLNMSRGRDCRAETSESKACWWKALGAISNVNVNFIVISKGLWTELLLISLLSVCVCVCMMCSNEVECGELMKFCLNSILSRCQVTWVVKTNEEKEAGAGCSQGLLVTKKGCFYKLVKEKIGAVERVLQFWQF